MLIVWTHLNILVMKPMMIHVEGITPSAHNPTIQIRLKVHTVIGVHVIATSVKYHALSKSAVQDGRFQIMWQIWQIQLVGQVLGDPFRQLEWKELQKRMVPPVRILK